MIFLLAYAAALNLPNTWRLRYVAVSPPERNTRKAVLEMRIEVKDDSGQVQEKIITLEVRPYAACRRDDAEVTYIQSKGGGVWATGLVRHPDITLARFTLSECPEDLKAQLQGLEG